MPRKKECFLVRGFHIFSPVSVLLVGVYTHTFSQINFLTNLTTPRSSLAASFLHLTCKNIHLTSLQVKTVRLTFSTLFYNLSVEDRNWK